LNVGFDKSDFYDEEVDVSIKRDTEDERAEIQYKQAVQRSKLDDNVLWLYQHEMQL